MANKHLTASGNQFDWLLLGLLAALVGCDRTHSTSEPVTVSVPATAASHPVEIRQPPIPRGVATTGVDSRGQAVVLECRSCHGIQPPNPATASSADLDRFHQGLHLSHGQLTCVSCHNSADHYSSLRLADGRSVPFPESMTLCSQCHGTQFRDYQRGAHGGMNGYWDLGRGGRTRNHCLHCHDPHAPKYPTFLPAAGPRDRFPPAKPGESHE